MGSIDSPGTWMTPEDLSAVVACLERAAKLEEAAEEVRHFIYKRSTYENHLDPLQQEAIDAVVAAIAEDGTGD